MNNNKFYLEAKFELHDETAELRKAAASVLPLPKDGEKQPDLLYFSAIFVSSGANLNRAYFLPSELLKAESTIVNKALDVEHKENDIIGHIYDRAFIDMNGNRVNVDDLLFMPQEQLNETSFHIAIAGIIYKARFPHLADEVARGEWKVSMECYYKDYDLKVGSVIISKKEAEVLGLTKDDSIFTRIGRVVKDGVEIARGHVERVLRDICFSGCGIVKQPANPPSVVLEVANSKQMPVLDSDVITIDMDIVNNKLTSLNIENTLIKNNEEISGNNNGLVGTNIIENSELIHNDTVGVCVNYKKKVFSNEDKGPQDKILHEDWCSLYDESCASFSRDIKDPNCLKNKVSQTVRSHANKLFADRNKGDRRAELLAILEQKIKNTKKVD